MSIKETLSQQEQVPVTAATGKRGRFAMLPLDILQRGDINVYDKVAIGIMNMESFGTGIVAISDQSLGDSASISRTQALKSRNALESVGLIEKFGPPKNQVQAYRLLHPDMQGTGTVSERNSNLCMGLLSS